MGVGVCEYCYLILWYGVDMVVVGMGVFLEGLESWGRVVEDDEGLSLLG